MAVSNTAKPIITMDALSDVLAGRPFIDYLVYTTDSTGAAGDLCILEDGDGDPVARFPVDGPNYTGIRWINRRIENMEIVTKNGNGGVLHVHVRL